MIISVDGNSMLRTSPTILFQNRQKSEANFHSDCFGDGLVLLSGNIFGLDYISTNTKVMFINRLLLNKNYRVKVSTQVVLFILKSPLSPCLSNFFLNKSAQVGILKPLNAVVTLVLIFISEKCC